MRRAWHILLLLSVLWCGLHCGGPTQAETMTQDALEMALHAPDAHDRDSGRTPLEAAHGGHHHCALAPCRLNDTPRIAPRVARGLLVARPSAPLATLTHAPPLDPPLA